MDGDRQAGERSPVRLRTLLVVTALAAFIAVAVGAVAVGRGLLRDAVPDLPRTETVDRSEPAVLLAVRDMAELRAASGQYHVIVDVEEDVPFVPSSIAGGRTLFVALGTVDAAVDLAGLGADAVEVSADGTAVTLTLPPAELTPPRIDPEGSYVYDRQQGFVNRVEDAVTGETPDDQALYQLATDMLAEAAAESDLRDRAQGNTRELLRGLLGALGFTTVEVVFAETPAAR